MPLADTTDPEELLAKRQLVELKRRRLEVAREDGLPFYRPHPKQDRFHRSLAKRRAAFTGNRFGKSTMGCAEDVAWLRGCRPWLPKTDLAYRSGIPQHPVKGLVIVNDWDKAKEIWTGVDGKIWTFLPRNGFVKQVTRNHSGSIDTMVCNSPFGGVSTLRFDTVKSFMSNPMGAESSDFDFIHIDEPCPEAQWKAVSRGLVDRSGCAWFTLTALSEPWITDKFDVEGDWQLPFGFVIEGTIYDNSKANGGYLPPDAIAAFEKDLTPDERECRLFGKPLHKAGLIYKQFQMDRHVLVDLPKGWESWTRPPVDWSYYYYIDPHAKVPHMVLFVVCDPHGHTYIYHDIFERCLIRDLCAEMHKVLDGRRVIRGRIDPIATIEDQISGSTWADDFALHGFPCDKAVKDPIHGIERVQAELTREPLTLHFTPACRRTLWEIKRWHWNEETNKPVDVDDHSMECLYRAILDNPVYVDPDNQRISVSDEVIDKPRFDLDDISFAD